MLLSEPAVTPFDLRFSLFNFPVRVSGWFWLAMLLLGGRFETGAEVLAWVAAGFLSILIHELGHAFAYRRYGMGCQIVLYHFGGLAIPDRFSPWSFAHLDRDPRRQIVISLAGPLAQIAGAACILLPLWALANSEGVVVGGIYDLVIVASRLGLGENSLKFVYFFLVVSVYWALLNLLPVLPLDGGKVSESLFQLYGGPQATRQALTLSLFAAGAAALYGFSSGSPFLGIMFAMLAFSSYQALEQYRGGWRF